MDQPTSLHEVSPAICRMAGYGGHTFVTLALSDRLEVPEEWQHTYSFDGRVFEVLVMAKAAMAAAGSIAGGVPFKVVFPNHFTGRPEVLDLVVKVDADADFVIDLLVQ